MIFLILSAGFLLRGLMLFSQKSLWGDEFFSVDLATKPFREVLAGSFQDVHPPLYFATLHTAIRCFGPEEWAFRLVSFLASCGTLVVIYYLGKAFHSKQSALYAAALAAVSPYWLQSSNEIRGYSLLALFSSLTILFFVKAMAESKKIVWKVGYLIFAVALVYTEHYGWFVLLATSTVLWMYRKNTEVRKFFSIQAVLFLFSSASLVIVAYQAVFREHVFQVYRIREYLSLSILIKKIAGTLWHLSNGYSFSMLTMERIQHYIRGSGLFWFSALSAFCATGLLCLGFRRLYRDNRAAFVLAQMIFCFSAVFLLLFYSIRFDARYFSFAAPLFFVLIGMGLTSIEKTLFRATLFAVLMTTALIGSFQTIFSRTDPIHKEDYRGLIATVFQKTTGKDAICGLSRQVFYYRDKLGPLPPVVFVPEVKDLSIETTRGVRRIWVMDIVNMHPGVSRKIFEEKKIIMAGLGFHAVGDPDKFGGEESLLAVYLFERQ